MRRQGAAKFHYPMIQEREPPLHRVRHHHPVPLRRKQVGRHERGHFQRLRLRQRAPPAEHPIEPVQELAHRIVAGHHGPQRRGKESLQALGIPPPDLM